MAVELWIDDGNPWYLSPDIWTVPSDDPNDPPGVPYANVSAYVWARVHNRGTSPVTNATVRFYWSNPASAINDSTAVLIGLSNVSLAAGETKPVLCVTPWIPQWVNNGHECLIAEAFASTDPLPARSAATPYNVPAWRQMAQKNLTIGYAMQKMAFYVHPFLAGNFGQREKVELRARRAPLDLLRPLLPGLGLTTLPHEAEGVERFGVQPYRCGDPLLERQRPEMTLTLPPRHQQGVALVVRLPEKFPPEGGALFLVEQIEGDQVTGGVGVLILAETAQKAPPAADSPVQTRTRKV